MPKPLEDQLLASVRKSAGHIEAMNKADVSGQLLACGRVADHERLMGTIARLDAFCNPFTKHATLWGDI